MRAGRLRNRLKIMTNGTKRNTFGELIGEDLIAEIYCEVNEKMETETNSNRTASKKTIEVKTRFNRQICTPNIDMYIEYNNTTYDITSVLNIRGLNRDLIITAIARS